MRRSLMLLSLMVVVSLVAVACGETRDTGFPPPAAADDEHGGEGENGGGDEADFEAEPQDGPDTELTIKALDIAFNREEMLFVADAPITLTFENLDANIPHNVAIYTDQSASEEVFVGDIFNGVETRDYSIPATPAGEYFFRCDVHPNMRGTATFS